MKTSSRKIAFVLASTDHGTMILNRLDYRLINNVPAYGVGFELLETSAFSSTDVDMVMSLLELRRQYYGDGVVAIDCGANIGVHTIDWAKKMTGWGSVIAIEAQERIFYALAGNISINNCFNATAIFAAVSTENGVMSVPRPNYLAPASFGSLELKKRDNNEFIGQPIEYNNENASLVRTLSLDSIVGERVDLIKIDIEGMELEALMGALDAIQRSRPILFVESIKVDQAELRGFLTKFEYHIFTVGLNFLAIHRSDNCLTHIKTLSSGDAARSKPTVPM